MRSRRAFREIRAIERGVVALFGLLSSMFFTVSVVMSLPPSDGQSTIVVAPASTAVAQLTLEVPPTPLEVAVLLDATGSYSAEMHHMTATLAAALDRLSSKGAVRVAIALAGDVPVFPFGVATDQVYTVLSQPTSNWQGRLQSVEAAEGGGDEPEGMLGALLALAGDGGRPSSASTAPIAFAQNVRRAVVVVTDSTPHENTDQWCGDRGCISYPGPSDQQVRDALAGRDIGFVAVTNAEPGALATLAQALDGVVIRADAADLVAQVAQALDKSKVRVAPTVRDCPSITAVFDPATRLVSPSESTRWQVTLSAEPDARQGARECIVAVGDTIAQRLSVSVVAGCSEATARATSTVAPSTTTVPPTSATATTPTTTSTTTTVPPTSNVPCPTTTTSGPTTSRVTTTVASSTTTVASSTTTSSSTVTSTTTTVAWSTTTSSSTVTSTTTTVASSTTTVASNTTTSSPTVASSTTTSTSRPPPSSTTRTE